MMTFLSVPRMYVKFFVTRLLLKKYNLQYRKLWRKIVLFRKVFSLYNISIDIMLVRYTLYDQEDISMYSDIWANK